MEQLKEHGPQAAKVVGTLLSAKGENDAGISADRLARYKAAQLKQNAGQEVAAATVAMDEEHRKSELIASRAIAVAAASGAGVLDPTVVKILQGIKGEGALASATQLYNGQESARGMMEQAKAIRFEGRASKKAGRKKAISTLMTGLNDASNTWGSSESPTKPKKAPEGDPFDNGVYTRAYA